MVGPDIDHALDTSKAGTFSHGGHRQFAGAACYIAQSMERPMIADIATHREELAALCRRFHVRRLDVFGSAARAADFDPARSDLDFLVEFEPLEPGVYVDAFFGLKEGLEQLFAKPVDLLTAASIRNPYFRQGVERSKALLYAA